MIYIWDIHLMKTLHLFHLPVHSSHLIDMFAFVDRAMNPIGNTIINPETLNRFFK